jgi:hypothetical protein
MVGALEILGRGGSGLRVPHYTGTGGIEVYVLPGRIPLGHSLGLRFLVKRSLDIFRKG